MEKKEKVKLPIGIENFEKIRTEGFYYVDKTDFIRELLDNWGEVNLFTRPRRFGKSLNMNMLRYFFEYGSSPELFEGLDISREKAYCEKYMGRFPVIFITLKGVEAGDYDGAKGMLRSIIRSEALRFQFLLESKKLTDLEKEEYRQLVKMDDNKQFSMPEEILRDSLRTLSELLQKHYSQKVILLVDEYDVPLDKAQQGGYYDAMVSLIRGLLGQVLKTNDSLQLAVLTGCLRITKESIFTGLNNLKTFSVTDRRFADKFGFTAKEVINLLVYYEFEDRLDIVRKWYDGYRFGNTNIYCPWDVINYIDMLCAEPEAYPRSYWINTSGNDIIRKFIQQGTPGLRRDLETLIAGGTVSRRIRQELTYRELYENTENLWSVLFTTGYLTRLGEDVPGVYCLAIPNLEIRQIFAEQVMDWFQEEVRKDRPGLEVFCSALSRGDAAMLEARFNVYLRKSVSIRDTAVRKDKKENFYHGLLLGLLNYQDDWLVISNAESGDGYSDILVELEEGIGIVIEVKYAEEGNLELACARALQQIEELGYEDRLRQDGMETIIRYGIACHKKKCKVKAVKHHL